MVSCFPTKIRRVGNSFGIIIPRETISTEGLEENDVVHISIWAKPVDRRHRHLREMAGSFEGLPGFERDREDRY